VSALRELQVRCYHAFLYQESAPLLADLENACIPAAECIEVYQNNARETFRKTLARAYPVIERLVGDSCFRGLARRYMLEHPSSSGDLQAFGASFAGFLSLQYADTEFDYLPAVARLEWAIEESLLEGESRPTSLAVLASLDPNRFGELVFEPASGVRFVSSTYPVLSIWSANQTEHAQHVDLAASAEHVALKRIGADVGMRLLDPAIFTLACNLASGMRLGDAAESVGPALDLEAALQVLVPGGYLGRISLAPAV
jgi:Putative DNA-binding domain